MGGDVERTVSCDWGWRREMSCRRIGGGMGCGMKGDWKGVGVGERMDGIVFTILEIITAISVSETRTPHSYNT